MLRHLLIPCPVPEEAYLARVSGDFSFLLLTSKVSLFLFEEERKNQNIEQSTTTRPESFSRISVLAATGGSTNSKESEESIPSWARPNSDEPPPWARDEGKGNESKTSIEIPYIAYLLASAVTAIAAIGSVFEYVNQRPVFGVVNSDSIFYAPLLGFFAITGLPTCAFLWFKAVQIANKEAEEQDRRDGYL
ncbi:hypothetical protein Nepgr_032639 [Nepenthes gracilis]|uniref:Uncharacterized protein n=1 Tax=Nepenthes gracilis TaxID=150966 RepID=A0AAD3Y8G1_NEPGR|nr:hypothetical protein Nepgr_032639 [Nepenthes gracilis]